MNIISNAIDAVPHGNGFLEVESKMIIGDNKEWAQVYFVDNGCGINEKDISRVFDPFYTTKEVGKGIGLGLSISHRIIQYHNGVIKIKSQKGEGTTVEILLPVSSQSIGGGEI